MTIGERIKDCRKDRRLTQKTLGELSGIAEPTIRKYESGRLNPKQETLKKIADGLGVTVEFLRANTVDSNTIPKTIETPDDFFDVDVIVFHDYEGTPIGTIPLRMVDKIEQFRLFRESMISINIASPLKNKLLNDFFYGMFSSDNQQQEIE